jgi:FtsP/CotA-like multicopper oxidase with cupredoxin domain
VARAFIASFNGRVDSELNRRDNPGDSLLHCHQQLHMDYGFMQTVKYKA